MIRPVLLVVAAAGALAAAQQPATIDLRIENAPLLQLIERIARQCDAGLVADASAITALAKPTTLQARDARWDEAMALLTEQYGIAIKLVGDRLEVSDADREFRKGLVLGFYDVRSLTSGLTAFPGPELDIPEPGGQGSRLLPPVEDSAPPELNQVVEVVKTRIAPGSWERDGVAIEELNGSLVVTQTPEVQRQVAALLAELERVAAREVVCRVYDLGVGAPAASTLDAAAWQAAAARAGAPIGVFVARDGQQNHHFVGVQRAYVADADVVQSVQDPIVGVVTQGLCVDVQPSVTVGGVLATVRLSASLGFDQRETAIADARGEVEVGIELPTSTVAASRDIRLTPLGGAALYAVGDRTYALAFEVVNATAPAAPAAEAKPTR